MLQPTPHEEGTAQSYWMSRYTQAATEIGNLTVVDRYLMDEASYQAPDTTTSSLFFFSSLPVLTAPLRATDRPAEPSQVDKLAASLLSYEHLVPGWDGYEGKPATSQAVQDALEFLDRRPNDIPLPYPQIAPDGEVGLYWHTEEVFTEVGFYGDGEFAYYARCSMNEVAPIEAGRDRSKVSSGRWPEALLLVLNKIKR